MHRMEFDLHIKIAILDLGNICKYDMVKDTLYPIFVRMYPSYDLESFL